MQCHCACNAELNYGNMKNWIFYGENKNGARVVHYIKRCKKPELTKERKAMMRHLDNYIYQVVGHMTADEWNRQNTYIKMNAQPIL